MYPTFPWYLLLLSLMCISAFCSASEAALFSLTSHDLRQMRLGTRPERRAADLLLHPDRLLSTLLLSNLLVNMGFFGIISIFTLRIQNSGQTVQAALFSFGALLIMICFCEMLPKAFAILVPRTFSKISAYPLSIGMLVLSPVLPVLSLMNRLSARLFFPTFSPEKKLNVHDLSRAVNVAETGPNPRELEKSILRNLVLLSDLRVEEIMRPRTLLPIFDSPLTREQLRTLDSALDCVFLQDSKPDSDAIASMFPLSRLVEIPAKDYGNLEKYALPTVYVPWNSTAGNALDILCERNAPALVVVNEFGETVGALLLADLTEALFSTNTERVYRITHQRPIHEVQPGVWEATGLMTLRMFAKNFNIPRPDNENATLAGLLMELFQSIPAPGDTCDWNGFHFEILENPDPARMKIRITREN